jgi:hypothetical protein
VAQQQQPNAFDVLAVVGAVTGVLSLGVQAWQAVADRPHLVLDFFDVMDVRFELSNNGRRPTTIRSFGFTMVAPGMVRPTWYQLRRRWQWWRQEAHAYEPFPFGPDSVAIPAGESLVVTTTRDDLRRKVLWLSSMKVEITGFVAIRSDGKHIRFPQRWRDHFLFSTERSDGDPEPPYYQFP